MYLDDKGEVIENLSLVGTKAAGVPGTVLGMWRRIDVLANRLGAS